MTTRLDPETTGAACRAAKSLWKSLRPERTLESLYLRPLMERVRANGGESHSPTHRSINSSTSWR